MASYKSNPCGALGVYSSDLVLATSEIHRFPIREAWRVEFDSGIRGVHSIDPRVGTKLDAII